MGKMKDFYNGLVHTDNATLNAVMTLPEVVEEFKCSRRQVEYAIWQDKLEARMATTGGSYLILRSSVEKLYLKRG